LVPANISLVPILQTIPKEMVFAVSWVIGILVSVCIVGSFLYIKFNRPDLWRSNVVVHFKKSEMPHERFKDDLGDDNFDTSMPKTIDPTTLEESFTSQTRNKLQTIKCSAVKAVTSGSLHLRDHLQGRSSAESSRHLSDDFFLDDDSLDTPANPSSVTQYIEPEAKQNDPNNNDVESVKKDNADSEGKDRVRGIWNSFESKWVATRRQFGYQRTPLLEDPIESLGQEDVAIEVNGHLTIAEPNTELDPRDQQPSFLQPNGRIPSSSSN